MTNQIQGEILFQGWAGDDTNPHTYAYTPWMPVRSDKATFGVEILRISANVDLVWDVVTRTLEDPNTFSSLFNGVTSETVGVHLKEADAITTSAQQLVRYRFSVPGTASTTNLVQFRALSPSWQVDR